MTIQEFADEMEQAKRNVEKLVRNMRDTSSIDAFQEMVAEELIDLLIYWANRWKDDDQVNLEHWRLASLDDAYRQLNDSVVGGFGSLMGQARQRATSRACYIMFKVFDHLLNDQPIWGAGSHSSFAWFVVLPRR